MEPIYLDFRGSIALKVQICQFSVTRSPFRLSSSFRDVSVPMSDHNETLGFFLEWLVENLMDAVGVDQMVCLISRGCGPSDLQIKISSPVNNLLLCWAGLVYPVTYNHKKRKFLSFVNSYLFVFSSYVHIIIKIYISERPVRELTCVPAITLLDHI